MRIFTVTRKTIYTRLNVWEQECLVGLYDRSGRGRKKTFNDVEQHQIRDWAKASPNVLNAVLSKIKEKWKVEVSKTTVKRILKACSMSWRRLRKSLWRVLKLIAKAESKLWSVELGSSELSSHSEWRFCDTVLVC